MPASKKCRANAALRQSSASYPQANAHKKPGTMAGLFLMADCLTPHSSAELSPSLVDAVHRDHGR